MDNQLTKETGSSPKCCVVIVTYNAMQWADKCIKSVLSSSIPVRIIVIDNDSHDGTAEYIHKIYPEVDLISSPINLGFGAGNNLGFRKALEDEYEYIFLLNQDAWVEQNTLELLIDSINENREFGVLSPVHLEANGKKMEYHFSTYVSPDACGSFLSDSFLGVLKSIYKVDFINAAAWLMKE